MILLMAGPQDAYKGASGPVVGVPKGAYAPAPYANSAYQQKPVPGYATGQPIYQQPRQQSGCCNVQWVLFAFGWIIGMSWFVGMFLPLFSSPRFKTPCHRWVQAP